MRSGRPLDDSSIQLSEFSYDVASQRPLVKACPSGKSSLTNPFILIRPSLCPSASGTAAAGSAAAGAASLGHSNERPWQQQQQWPFSTQTGKGEGFVKQTFFFRHFFVRHLFVRILFANWLLMIEINLLFPND